MTLKEAAELVDLPASIVERLHRDGIIDDPVSELDLKGLVILSHVRGRAWYMRKMLAPLPRGYRLKILQEGDLSRAERYALSCYLEAKKGERVFVQDVMQRVHDYLGVELGRKQVERIRAIAYDIRRGKSRKALDL
ncbi:hypothetical protein EDC39_11291 [Geothermobacter ehrlichii]|uniref:Uncharacterized protein n=1 Tax=Geothermobacter ehrlichii TaxID=213224 RepID=A0A5D3WKH7_9BACT|nr:hypothetical protein [Geothermobacter ehrlichii]TYO96803.1 hypothetical protein EDC39_11291 [Geothermobacter ehrlichii]